MSPRTLTEEEAEHLRLPPAPTLACLLGALTLAITVSLEKSVVGEVIFLFLAILAMAFW
jgi:hypothetical protein